ncbi:MAG: hypothetical protein AAB585_00075 [Patescibacteria group bacterium]
MPKFEAMPKPGRPEKEEETPEFKIVDKRVGPEALKRAEEESRKKKFDTMTLEQREEWEYNRDKERGFKIKDKRGAVDIEDYRSREVESEPAPAPEVPEMPETPPVETPAPPAEPRPESAADSLRRQAQEIRQEAADLRISVDSLRDQAARAEKEIEMKYGGPAGRKMITLESTMLRQNLLQLYANLEQSLRNLASIEKVPFERDALLEQAKEINQKELNLKTETPLSQKLKKPFGFLRKLFGN